ncbi:MAG TPA: antibiotic biosynthesis monooxygenase family protein [Chloroflexota bacterium]|nr:antibiotic biosynthesis monooxygenase family protein [Chloroflexota bacterium]
MIVEVAVLEAKPGQADAMRDGLRKARPVIERAAGYRGSTFHQSIEKPERFVLYIKWDNVAAHVEGFRQSPLFSEWRSYWGEHLNSADVLHYEIIAGET